MESTRRSGITLEEPDIAHWYLAGDVTANDIREIYAIQTKFCEGKPFIFVLVNVRELRSISAEARRLAAEGPKLGHIKHPARGHAIIGASFHFRVIGTLIAKAATVIHRKQDSPTHFFENEADARAWLAERRREIEPSL